MSDEVIKEVKEELSIVEKDKWLKALELEIGIDFNRYKDKDTRLMCIDLKLRGIPMARIYEIYSAINMMKQLPSITKESLEEWITDYCPDIDLTELQVYNEYRQSLFNKIEHKAIQKLSEKLEGMDVHEVDDKGRPVVNLKDVVYAFDKLVDKRRLEENKATSKTEQTHSVILDSLTKRRLQSEGKVIDV